MGAKILTIANQKGGVGKTTTTLSLAAALAKRGKKALAIDLDPHVSASIHLQYYPEKLPYTAYNLFTCDESEFPQMWDNIRYKEDRLYFDFVPSHVRLSELEMDLRDRPGKGEILTRALSIVQDEYDYILLDCPPHVGILLVNALVGAGLLVIPIQTEFLALNGLRLIFDTIRTLNRVLPKPIDYQVLATMYDQRAGACKRVMNLLRRKMGHKMFETIIHQDTKFREACAHGKVIYDIAPQSRGALEYMLLAKEIEERL